MAANVRRMREQAKKAEASRKQAEAEKKSPFTLRQFANVPPRVMEPRRSPSTPSRPSSASSCRADNGEASIPRRAHGSPSTSQDTPATPAWRVSSGYGSLSSPQRGSLSEPVREPFTPPSREIFTPPPRAAPRQPAHARACSTPVKPGRARSPARRPPSPCSFAEDGREDWDGNSPSRLPAGWADWARGSDEAGRQDEGGFDVGRFEQLAKQMKQLQGESTPAKDAQGRTTQLQRKMSSPTQSPLSYSGEANNYPPAGYRVMSEQERLETLETLQPKLAMLEKSYSELPLRIETEGQINRQRTLKQKIEETEEAIKLFSRQAVLVET